MGYLKKICRDRRAISQGTTAIILAVVAIIIAGAVAGLVMTGGGPAAPKVEALAMAPGSEVRSFDKGYKLVLENSGTADATITMIEIGGADVASVEKPVTKYPVVVTAGTTVSVEGKVGFAGACFPNAQYEYHVYTAAGHNYAGWLFAT